jgi:hypothetical protein
LFCVAACGDDDGTAPVVVDEDGDGMAGDTGTAGTGTAGTGTAGTGTAGTGMAGTGMAGMGMAGMDGDGDGQNLPEVDCTGDVPAFADVAAFDKCTMCHSSELMGAERNGAPANANWDVEQVAVDRAEDMAMRVFMGLMPPPGSGITLTQAEEDQLYLWALCEP